LERGHFREIKRKPYIVCEKIYGERCLLVFKGCETVLFDKGVEPRSIIMTGVPKGTRNGTIFDGVLMPDSTFVIHDAVVVCGEDMKGLDLLSRLERIERFISGTIESRKNTVKLELRTFFTIKDIKYSHEQLYFMSVLDSKVFKWKMPEKYTVSFEVKNSTDLCVSGIFECVLEEPTDHDVIECRYEPSIMRWRPVRARKYPNNRKTFYHTLRAVHDNIRIPELVRSFTC